MKIGQRVKTKGGKKATVSKLYSNKGELKCDLKFDYGGEGYNYVTKDLIKI